MNGKLSKLLTISLFLLLIFTLLIGCTYPVEPEVVESPIDCNGHYWVHFRDWQICGCPSCETYDRGTYWVNYSDERVFLIGEAVLKAWEIYGKCPTGYIKEIVL